MAWLPLVGLGRAETYQFLGSTDSDNGGLWSVSANWKAGVLPNPGTNTKIELLGPTELDIRTLDIGSDAINIGEISLLSPNRSRGGF
jgi:hypothetical protein